MKLLLVDDDPRFSNTAKMILQKNFYEIDLLDNGKLVLPSLEKNDYDLLILDVMIPFFDGISICRTLRKNNYEIPILLLTALQGKNDKLKAFEAGGDDYLIKPFDWDELLARIRALLRRKDKNKDISSILEYRKFVLNFDTKQVSYDDQNLSLTPTEYKILEIFLNNPTKLFSMDNLVDQLWELDDIPTNSTIRSHIKGLRRKLKKVDAPDDIIKTVYGMGYRLNCDENEEENEPENLHKTNDNEQELITIKETINLSSIDKNKPINKEIKETKQQRISKTLLKIWEMEKQSVFDDINFLYTYNQEINFSLKKEEFVRKSHNLVGFLGSIGLLEASGICKQLENLFKEDSFDKNKHKKTLNQQLNQLFISLQELDNKELKSIDDNSSKINQINKTILIIDNPSNLINKLSKLSQLLHWHIILTSNVKDVLKTIKNINLDGIIVDPYLENNKNKSDKILKKLKEKLPDTPLIVLTEKDDLQSRLEATKFQVKAFLSKNMQPEKIINIIDKSLNPSENYKVLLVDDDPKFLNSFKAQITDNKLEIVTTNDPLKLYEFMDKIEPELLILDLQMPNLNGIDLCKIVRNDPRWYRLPIIFLTAHLDNNTIDQIIAAGADDFVPKSKIGLELNHRIITHLKRFQRLKRIS